MSAADLAQARQHEQRQRRDHEERTHRAITSEVHAGRHGIIRFVPTRSRAKAWVLIVLVLLVAVVGSVAYLVWRQTVPGVQSLTTAPRFIGQKSSFTVVVEARRGNVARVEVRIEQSGKSTPVATKDSGLGKHVEIPVVVDSAALGLREGSATIEVWARDTFWRPIRRDDRAIAGYPVTIDLTPPRVELLAATHYLSPGGSGLVAFRSSGASRTDVIAGAMTFPSFAYGPADKGARIVLIALPWDYDPATPIQIRASDEAGNAAARGIPAEIRPRKFPKDTIDVKDAFLQAKVPELLPQRPATDSLVDGFLMINRDLRRQAEEAKRKIGASTADKPLWHGPFVQARNTKVFANFAETRTYVHGGKEIDRQIHFGYDLASTRQSPVPAANKGVVVFAEPLTIYGNTVVIDHGLGLQTLYAHLSSTTVKVGDAVEKGQEIARTGSTGLAMGDHLHYEVLVSGTSVTPLEWWDAKWIRDHIGKPLNEASLPEISGAESRGEREEPTRPAAPRSTRRRR
jgi:murein DD-endopeptidase MepM/ murein hydrolase activator NlpD